MEKLRLWTRESNGRTLDVALLEHYTSINDRTIMMRAMFLDIDD